MSASPDLGPKSLKGNRSEGVPIISLPVATSLGPTLLMLATYSGVS